MSLNIDHLVIEATRKCNMNCRHCLRGAAQRKTANRQHVYKLMQLIDNVSTLTITGGEPTLAMDVLEEICHCIKYGRTDVNSFFMVTNGKAINIEKLAAWLGEMHFVCSDNEVSSLGFSFDNYHSDTFNCNQLEKRNRNFERLQEAMSWQYGIDNENFVHKHTDSNTRDGQILQEGRAKEWGCQENRIEIFEEDNYGDDEIRFSETELYLTCSGYLVCGCNWSYETMDNDENIRIAHLDDINSQGDLIESIRTYNRKRESVLVQA